MDEATKELWDAECERVAGEVECLNRLILDLDDSIDDALPDNRRPNAAFTILVTLAQELARVAGMSPHAILSRAGATIAEASPAPPLSDGELREALARSLVPPGVPATPENQLVTLIMALCALVFPRDGAMGETPAGTGDGCWIPDPRRALVALAQAASLMDGKGTATVVVSPTGQETTTAIVHHPDGRVKTIDCNPLTRRVDTDADHRLN